MHSLGLNVHGSNMIARSLYTSRDHAADETL